MKYYFPYNPSEPVEITGEVHTIEDGTILLKHIPYANSIEIDGFVQTDSMVLLEHQFRCDYGTELNYRESSCLVYFNEVHNGLRVIVNYLCVGTIIIAEDLNEIKDHLDNQKIHNTYSLPTASTLEKGGVRIGQGLEMVGDVLNVTVTGNSEVDFSAHNQSSSSHPFIQNLISDEISARIQSVSELHSRIDSLSARIDLLNTRIDNLPAPTLNFLGSANTLPAEKSFGDLVFVDGKAFIFDGNSWLSFCTCEASPPTPAVENSVTEEISYREFSTIINGPEDYLEYESATDFPDWTWSDTGEWGQIYLPYAFTSEDQLKVFGVATGEELFWDDGTNLYTAVRPFIGIDQTTVCESCRKSGLYGIYRGNNYFNANEKGQLLIKWRAEVTHKEIIAPLESGVQDSEYAAADGTERLYPSADGSAIMGLNIGAAKSSFTDVTSPELHVFALDGTELATNEYTCQPFNDYIAILKINPGSVQKVSKGIKVMFNIYAPIAYEED